MDVVRHRHRHLDVACELGSGAVADRADEWRRIRGQAGAAEPIPGGARLWLAAGARPEVEDLVAREAECCGFLDLEVAATGDRVRLDITSPAPEARTIIQALAGVEPG